MGRTVRPYALRGSPALSAGDLFLDIGDTEHWDYVVTSNNGNIYSFGSTEFSLGSNATIPSSENYILSWGGGNGYIIRQNHPVLLNQRDDFGTLLDQSSSVTGSFDSSTTNPTQTFIFDNLNLWVGYNPGNLSDLRIGWTVSCANDVIFEKIQYTSHVPEPGTMILLGFGLIGLAAVSRKKLTGRQN